MTQQDLFEVIKYVTNAPMFWGSMGFTTAIAMFIGALVYDGELEQASKGVFSVVSYVIMLLWVMISRVLSSLNTVGLNEPAKAWAGTLTILLITIFWLIGILLGVLILRTKYKGWHRK